MRSGRFIKGMCACVGALLLAVGWQPDIPSVAAQGEPTNSSAQGDTNAPQPLTDKIDRALSASWSSAHVEPAAPAGDAEFMRRAYLDLTGKIPSVERARTFLAD